MGIDISDSLMVGASYDEIEDFIQSKIDSGEYQNAYEVGEVFFDQASPHYDSSIEERFLGYSIPNYTQPTDEWFQTVKKAADKFEKLTGVKAMIRGGCDVC